MGNALAIHWQFIEYIAWITLRIVKCPDSAWTSQDPAKCKGASV